MNIISRYHVHEDQRGEAMKLVAQYVYNESNMEKALEKAREATAQFIDKGLYLYREEIYVHPKGAKKPWQNKYKKEISPLF